MKKYPKTVYVVRENAGTADEYLQVLEDPKEVDLRDESKRVVATYELRGSVEVTKEIRVQPRRR